MEDVLTTLRDMLLNIQKTEDDAAQADKDDNGANKDGEISCLPLVGYYHVGCCCCGKRASYYCIGVDQRT
jgi:hypothetical protein